MTLVATRPIQEAMVTLGGVATAEIDPDTMGSRLARACSLRRTDRHRGLYGWLQSQAAFATGLAGEVAAGATGYIRDCPGTSKDLLAEW